MAKIINSPIKFTSFASQNASVKIRIGVLIVDFYGFIEISFGLL